MKRPVLDEAIEILHLHQEEVDALRGHRVRVVRAILYEGPAEWLLPQLARSLPMGEKVVRGRDLPVNRDDADPERATITVTQGRFEVLD